MRGYKVRLRKYIIHVAGRAFAQGVCTPFVSLVMRISVRFAIPVEKQMKRMLKT
jgi:hypothetical protein